MKTMSYAEAIESALAQAMSEDEFCGREIWVQNEALRIR